MDEERYEFLRAALEETCPAGRLVTNWILVVESTDGTGSDLHMASSDGVTPWLTLGMLEAAKQIAYYQYDEDE